MSHIFRLNNSSPMCVDRMNPEPCAVNRMNPEQEAGSGSLFSDQILCLASQLLPQVEQPVPVLAIQQVPTILELPPRIFSTAFMKERVV